MIVLDPLSIATSGYIGIGPAAGDFCPLPLAIGTDGYIRFEVDPFDRRDGDGGSGIRQWEEHKRRFPERYPAIENNAEDLALLAVIAIEEHYGD